MGPLNPADIGEMLGLDPAAAFDAALITDGLPLICAEWRPEPTYGSSSATHWTTHLRAAGLRGLLPAAPAIGGYWTRSNDVAIDLVGADRQPVAKELLFLGSDHWADV
ncbi:hypothetical protein [Streptomyces sp. 2P-4]|uniref:hypothetical protein n=1 Tax=Streptomyces sp. 2P-4 TaxID=2931974 RepID=UPI00254245EB|nr:hypothetical protein [Streptomyces sp. 2P-4]